MVVGVLLVVVLAAVLVPPALGVHEARRNAFLGSLGHADGSKAPVLPSARSQQVQRRRQILGGLLIAMAGTGVVGLLPTFRALLVVHLFLIDAFLGYVAVLAHLADRRSRRPAAVAGADRAAAQAEAVGNAGTVLAMPPTRPDPRPAVVGKLPPVAAAG